MPVITPQDPSLKTLSGLHLWHAPLSSCSQRVRLTMAETGQTFTSHLIDLERGEHASESYQKIHPKGLVPAMVDDGELVIESIDIIRHLVSDAPALVEGVDQDLLDAAGAAQLDLKLLTFEFLFRGAPPPSDEDAISFQRNHNNEWLRQFYLDFAAGFDPERIQAAACRIADGFARLDKILSDGRPYLCGDTFTLADIAWLPNAHRFDLMDWPWDRTPNLALWFERVSQRPSYKSALVEWENTHAIDIFRKYTAIRREKGTHLQSYLDRCA